MGGRYKALSIPVFYAVGYPLRRGTVLGASKDHFGFRERAFVKDTEANVAGWSRRNDSQIPNLMRETSPALCNPASASLAALHNEQVWTDLPSFNAFGS